MAITTPETRTKLSNTGARVTVLLCVSREHTLPCPPPFLNIDILDGPDCTGKLYMLYTLWVGGGLH